MGLHQSKKLQEAVCCGDVERVRAILNAANVSTTDDKVLPTGSGAPRRSSSCRFSVFHGRRMAGMPCTMERGQGGQMSYTNSSSLEPMRAYKGRCASPRVRCDSGDFRQRQIDPILLSRDLPYVFVISALRKPSNAQAGRTALHYAALGGWSEAIHMLCRHGASVDARDHKGNTPLDYAVVHGHSEAVKKLMSLGAASSSSTSVKTWLCTANKQDCPKN